MQKSLFLVVLSLVIASCQSFRSSDNASSRVRREIANLNLLKGFIDDIARQTQKSATSYTSKQIERKVLDYIKRKEKDMAFGNWSKMGLMDDQVKQINGLYDDLPYMNKVHKWVSENITRIIKVETSIAESAYALMMRRSKPSINPYKNAVSDANEMMMNRRNSSSPFQSTAVKENIIKSKIRQVKDRNIRKVYQENYTNISKRSDISPALEANYHEILESATKVTRKTGHSGMGSGCKAFNEKASLEVLEMKANIDIYRARLIEEKAYQKAGREFASVDDISSAKRLTTKEIDDATEEAFENVLNYTREEARIAVRRLKNKPCKVY
jgi:hypothetical protein